MTELEFKSLANEGYNRIPMIAEAFADLETPLTLYLKLAQTQNAGRNTFLLDFIEQFQARFKVALRPGLPRFCGGLAGYFGYDTVRHIEKKLADSMPKDDLGLPDIQLMVTEELAV